MLDRMTFPYERWRSQLLRAGNKKLFSLGRNGFSAKWTNTAFYWGRMRVKFGRVNYNSSEISRRSQRAAQKSKNQSPCVFQRFICFRKLASSCLSVRLTEQIFLKLMVVAFVKICREDPNMLQLEQARRAHYMITAARLIVASDWNLP